MADSVDKLNCCSQNDFAANLEMFCMVNMNISTYLTLGECLLSTDTGTVKQINKNNAASMSFWKRKLRS